jgi:hypothetical protein
MRWFALCSALFLFSSQFASAAVISVVLNGNRDGGAPGEAFTGYTPPAQNQSGTGDYGSSLGTFGTVTPGNVPGGGFQANYAAGNYNFGLNKRGFVSTGVTWTGSQFYSTTQAWYDQAFTAVSGTPMVLNSGYWEFSVNGIYNYRLEGQAPQISTNIRTYRFEKVGVSVLDRDDLGRNNTLFTGTINSGTYRLYYDHVNYTPNINGPSDNLIGGTYLNLFFFFQSEDNPVVPEPASAAIFGMVALGATVLRLRRSRAV